MARERRSRSDKRKRTDEARTGTWQVAISISNGEVKTRHDAEMRPAQTMYEVGNVEKHERVGGQALSGNKHAGS